MSETKNEKKSHYISGKESRRIAKENIKATKYYEKLKKKRKDPSEYLTEMKDEKNILEIDDLHTFFFTDAGTVKAVNGVTFSIPQGATVGVVGESGCGKSVTSLSTMQLVQGPAGQIVSGSIRFKSNMFKLDSKGKKIPVYETKVDENGQVQTVLDERGKPVIKKNNLGGNMYEMEDQVVDIAKMPVSTMRTIRGREIAMIFQEPMTSLNPVFTIGNQLDEVAFLHIQGISKAKAKERSIEMLNLVGIADPEGVYKKFPHQLSGGMRQRVMIAMALLCNPKLIIADEPTTALDVTIQAQIIDLLRNIKSKINGSIMLITHDLGVVAEMADFVVVMYAGKIIEMGTAADIYDNPLHPYTIGLQKSKPTVDSEVDSLYCIPGFVPNPVNMPNYCYFRDRCDRCREECAGDYPELIKVSDTHSVSCYLYKAGTDATQANKAVEPEKAAEPASKIAEPAKSAPATDDNKAQSEQVNNSEPKKPASVTVVKPNNAQSDKDAKKVVVKVVKKSGEMHKSATNQANEAKDKQGEQK
ncbi:MAG: ABC transporter ATP-binding protein [Clostridiales bacterium]|nr:ABC transporter ATP-binding protein [Clostridiales bacterium]